MAQARLSSRSSSYNPAISAAGLRAGRSFSSRFSRQGGYASYGMDEMDAAPVSRFDPVGHAEDAALNAEEAVARYKATATFYKQQRTIRLAAGTEPLHLVGRDMRPGGRYEALLHTVQRIRAADPVADQLFAAMSSAVQAYRDAIAGAASYVAGQGLRPAEQVQILTRLDDLSERIQQGAGAEDGGTAPLAVLGVDVLLADGRHHHMNMRDYLSSATWSAREEAQAELEGRAPRHYPQPAAPQPETGAAPLLALSDQRPAALRHAHRGRF